MSQFAIRVDARIFELKDKHPAIFKAFDELKDVEYE